MCLAFDAVGPEGPTSTLVDEFRGARPFADSGPIKIEDDLPDEQVHLGLMDNSRWALS